MRYEIGSITRLSPNVYVLGCGREHAVPLSVPLPSALEWLLREGATTCIDRFPKALLRFAASMSMDWVLHSAQCARTIRQVSGPVAFAALALVCLLVAMGPLSTALDIHHIFAAADHDGHEHSDGDLCQWVQQHTGHSLPAIVPLMERYVLLLDDLIPLDRFFLASVVVSGGAPRAPPIS